MNIDPEIAAMDAEIEEAMSEPKTVTVYTTQWNPPMQNKKIGNININYVLSPALLANSDFEIEPDVINFKFPENTQEIESKPNPRKRKSEETKEVLYPRKKPRLTKEVRDLLLNSINNQPRLIAYNLATWEQKYGPNAVILLNKGCC